MDTPTSYLLPMYAAYSAAAIGLTVFLARTLFKNGRVFLEEVFKDSPKIADAVNTLLVVGFYLINFGYASIILPAHMASTATQAVEVLSSKLGILLLSLGGMHFGNLLLFNRIRARATVAHLPPPVVPQLRLEAKTA